MSGGHYDYSYAHLSEMIDAMKASPDPLRREFAKHLILVQEAMHDVEWVDSGDCAPGDEHRSIRRVLRGHPQPAGRTKKVYRHRGP